MGFGIVLGVVKNSEKNATRESLYTGKFVYGKESGQVYIDRHLSNILNNALEGAVFPSVLKVHFFYGVSIQPLHDIHYTHIPYS